MMKKVFEGFVTVTLWIGTQFLAFVIGYLASVLIYEAVDDWISDDWVLGLFFVTLNTGVSMWKLLKKRMTVNK